MRIKQQKSEKIKRQLVRFELLCLSNDCSLMSPIKKPLINNALWNDSKRLIK